MRDARRCRSRGRSPRRHRASGAEVAEQHPGPHVDGRPAEARPRARRPRGRGRHRDAARPRCGRAARGRGRWRAAPRDFCRARLTRAAEVAQQHLVLRRGHVLEAAAGDDDRTSGSAKRAMASAISSRASRPRGRRSSTNECAGQQLRVERVRGVDAARPPLGVGGRAPARPRARPGACGCRGHPRARRAEGQRAVVVADDDDVPAGRSRSPAASSRISLSAASDANRFAASTSGQRRSAAKSRPMPRS